MAKEIILYNLASHVTDEEYQTYVDNEKGPLLDSLESVTKFELAKVCGSMSGEIPYKYVGIMHLTSPRTSTRRTPTQRHFKHSKLNGPRW